jgi:hypothetical protein
MMTCVTCAAQVLIQRWILVTVRVGLTEQIIEKEEIEDTVREMLLQVQERWR